MRQPGYYSPGVGCHSDVGDNGFNLKVRSFLNKGGGGRVVCSAGICGLNVVGRLTRGAAVHSGEVWRA